MSQSGGNRLSPLADAKIRELGAAGLSNRAIADEVGCSVCTVYERIGPHKARREANGKEPKLFTSMPTAGLRVAEHTLVKAVDAYQDRNQDASKGCAAAVRSLTDLRVLIREVDAAPV